LAHFKDVLTLNDIEPLILVVVKVATRTTLRMMRHLDNYETATTVLSRDLEEDPADPTTEVLIQSIHIPRNPELLYRCI
jgi:hypothetical protein